MWDSEHCRCQTLPLPVDLSLILSLVMRTRDKNHSLTKPTEFDTAQSCLQARNFLHSPATKQFLFITDVNYCFLIIMVTYNHDLCICKTHGGISFFVC